MRQAKIGLLFFILVLALFFIGKGISIQDRIVVGDESSHILQALSIAYDGDLKFDESDAVHWSNLGWNDTPRGLFFQKYSEGFAFAKPYGYSLFLAFFIFLFGKSGLIIGNVALLGLTCFLIFNSLREIYNYLEASLLTATVTFFSYLYLYAYYIHSDIFLAFLVSLFVYVLLKALKKFSFVYVTLLAIVSAFIVAEKIPLIVVIAPLMAYLLVQKKNTSYAITYISSFIIAFSICIMPYLYYSDYKAWNPYSGERYYNSTGKIPISFNEDNVSTEAVLVEEGGVYKLATSPYIKLDTGKHFAISYLIENANIQLGKEIVRNVVYYICGSFTGILIFMPISMIIFSMSAFRAIRKRNWLLVSAMSGVLGYIFFYIVLFPTNYYGGGHSLGNRYFLQMSTISVLLMCVLQLSRRQVLIITALSGVTSAVLLHHHHLSGKDAYLNIFRMSYLQSLMPTEITQWGVRAYSNDHAINLNLYPSSDKYFSSDKYIKRELRISNDEKFGMYTLRTPFKQANGGYEKAYLNGDAIYIGDGFNKIEEGRVWSNSISEALVENDGTVKTFSVIPGAEDLSIKILIKNEVIQGVAPYSFRIDTRKYSEKYIRMNFLAALPSLTSDGNYDPNAQPSIFYLTGDNNRAIPFARVYDTGSYDYVKRKYTKVLETVKIFEGSFFGNGKEILTKGFHQQEGGHIWSTERSSLLLRQGKEKEHYVIDSFTPDNTIVVEYSKGKVKSKAPFLITIPKTGDRDWVKLEWQANSSASPSSLSVSSDPRLLSFSITPIDKKNLVDVPNMKNYYLE